MADYEYVEGNCRWVTTVKQIDEADIFSTVFHSFNGKEARLGYVTWHYTEYAEEPSEDNPNPEIIEKTKEFLGVREWWKDGVRHREDGPAVIYYNHEEEVTEEQNFLEGKNMDLYGTSSAVTSQRFNWLLYLHSLAPRLVSVPGSRQV